MRRVREILCLKHECVAETGMTPNSRARASGRVQTWEKTPHWRVGPPLSRAMILILGVTIWCRASIHKRVDGCTASSGSRAADTLY
jgi:hypothetical protein